MRPCGVRPWGTHDRAVQLLVPDVRQYRQVVVRVVAAQHQHDEYRRRRLVHDLHRNAPAQAGDLNDKEATAVIRYLFAGPPNVLNPTESWGLEHLRPRGEDCHLEVVPPDTNRRSSFAGHRLLLGERKTAESSYRDEVVSAIVGLSSRHQKQAFTAREVQVEILARDTSYAESTVFRLCSA
ncbi:MAG: hypothetical protein ACRDWN_02280 [Acidimicrobiales bacterium]